MTDTKKRDGSDSLYELVSLPDWLIAKAMCEACGEDVYQKGDARGNAFRWEDYLECVERFRKSLKFYAD